MKVILTHHNADFDAIASLLAMHKLEPDAVPVLPTAINQNVAQFLHLYDRDWKMLKVQDLAGRGRIEEALVVDTYKFNQVRGMHPQTEIYIFDHHTISEPLPAYHHIVLNEPTGANVTLLVERLVERGVVVDALEATLLILGIYEDTGSLSFKSTTPRDIRAAAWLLEQNADLDAVRQFLRYSMNAAQAQLYEALQESALPLTIKGHHIVIAAGMAQEQVQELALVAAELLKLFDCDGLLAVIQIIDDVQIIARAVVDEIDMGELLRYFNGNGHNRAAAAFVRDSNLDQTCKRLIDLLPQVTYPATRVEALMSQGVITLNAETTLLEAEETLQQTAHEGYPVLRGGRVVGLLTRRAYDRARLHNLHKLRVGDVMEAGAHSISPVDSVETLKDRMLETGWGQMPVVDENSALLGIVTRTDLIKHWGSRPGRERPESELLEKIRDMLPTGAWALLEATGEMAQSQQKGLYMVGGIVRDMLLGRRNLDIDLVVEGDAIELAFAMQKRYGGKVLPHHHFRTANWHLDAAVCAHFADDLPPVIDFATSRAEFYKEPSVLPTVRSGSIKLDLHRRDFSINALAIRLAPKPIGHLLDFYNGVHDLNKGLVRVLHSLSFIDDPTRMLRAVRFEQRFGFHIEPRTEELLVSALPMLTKVSGDRIRHEFNQILAERQTLAIFKRLEDLGVLRMIDPHLGVHEHLETWYAECEAVQQNPPWELPTAFDNWGIIRFALLVVLLPQEVITSLSKRLLLAASTRDILLKVRQGYEKLPSIATLPPSGVVEHFEKYGDTAWLALWMMGDLAARSQLEQLVTRWHAVQPALGGKDLLVMGMQASPAMGELLAALRIARLDGVLETADDERDFAQKHIQQLTAQS